MEMSSLFNNNRRISPNIITDDGTYETEEEIYFDGNGKDLLTKQHFEASKISLIRQDQADNVDRLLECIRDDDGPGADEFLSGLSNQERRDLLCEPILAQAYEGKPSKDNFYRRMDYSWVSLIVAGSGSDQVFEVIVKHGAPLDVHEADGSTIGHAVAYGSYFMPDMEVEFVRIYFHFTAEIGCSEKLRGLMMSENRGGARPLELAAILGKFEIFYSMMETENLYKTIDIRQGTWNRATYNFLEYEETEPMGRRGKSPLKIFSYLREKDLDSPGFRRVFLSPPIQAWIKQHVNTTRFILFLWFTIRTVFTGVYMSVLSRISGVPTVSTTTDESGNAVNISTCPAAYGIVIPGVLSESIQGADMIYLTLCMVCFAVFDICDGLHSLLFSRKSAPFFDRPGLDVPYIVRTVDHRLMQVVFVINVFITLLLRSLESEVLIYSYVFSILVVALTYMYFLQFLPGIGYLVIGLQRSMSTFASFSAIFFLIFVTFSLAFFILNHICCLQFTLGASIYQTFQIFLNQVNIVNDFECEYYRREAWMVFHILYIMFMVILLLNFCIAILSESAIRITNHKDILQDLQYLNAAMLIEDRIGWAARPFRKFAYDDFKMGLVKASVNLRQPFAHK